MAECGMLLRELWSTFWRMNIPQCNSILKRTACRSFRHWQLSTCATWRYSEPWRRFMISWFTPRRDGLCTRFLRGWWDDLWSWRTRWWSWSTQSFTTLMTYCRTSKWHLWVRYSNTLLHVQNAGNVLVCRFRRVGPEGILKIWAWGRFKCSMSKWILAG